MCGIVGIYYFDSSRRCPEALLRQMTGTMSHRGPDGEGYRFGEGYALGHRRLSIIDLSGGQQPISGETERTWTIANGEIYNFRELREELRTFGHQFRTGSDSEVIVHAHEQWGERAIERLDGMYAYAYVDETLQRLVLGRDRLGIKPLYYAQFDGSLIFASEIKALLCYPHFPRRLQLDAVASYLDYRYVVGDRTFFEGIRQVPPGHRLIADPRGVRLEQYWELPHEAETLAVNDTIATATVLDKLQHAVKQRLVADVPLGAYLSGGLDSSLIVALMARQSSTGVRTYSTGFEEEGYNEFAYARSVAAAYQTQHREIVLSPERYFELLPELTRYKDAPLGVPNEVPLWQMSRVLKQDITVVLSGEGADELFCGYGRIFRAAEQLDPDATSVCDAFLERYGYFGAKAWNSFLSADVRAATTTYPKAVFREAFETVAHLSPLRQFQWVFQKHHLPGLLQRLDTTTMAASVEGRVPFVDHHLVEYGHRLPSELKLRWKSQQARQQAHGLSPAEISEQYDVPKWVLRQIGRQLLPEAVVDRKKVGFPVPLGKWLGGQLHEQAKAVLLAPACRQRGIVEVNAVERFLESPTEASWDDGMRIWSLLCLETFLSEYFD